MQAMNVQAPSSDAAVFNPSVGLAAAGSNDIVLRHLVGPAEIASVAHLRGEIDLSAHAAAAPGEFERLEKKETNWGLSSPSTFTESELAPFGSFQWATRSP